MIRALILPFLAALMAMMPVAYAQPVDGGRAMVELITERERVEPGETFYAAIKMDLDAGWHVYWRNAGDAGLPPQVDVLDGSDITEASIGPFVWPIPHLLPVVEGEIMDYGYDDRLVLPFPLTIPADAMGSVQLNLLADYLICEEICIPETAEVSLTLPVGPSEPHIEDGMLISKWIAKAPRDFDGEARIDASSSPWKLSLKTEGGFDPGSNIRFYPFGHEISHPADQPLSFGSDGATLSLTPADDSLEAALEGIVVVETPDGDRAGYTIAADQGSVFENTAGIAARSASSGAGGKSLIALALAAVIGGLILNLMPCVLPVLSIKAMGMVHAVASGHESEVRSHGLWYTGGVLLSFAALAAAIIAIREATGTANLGFQLQNGPTVAVLTLIMFVIGLWLLGMFELGTSIQNTGSSLASRSGSMGAFFTGVLAAVVGAPCIGPFLGAALGAVLDRPAISVLIVFLAMGLGLALPYLVLSFVPGLSRLLPKPGRWMETLKQFFAFPMFLTAALLLWTLGAVSGPAAVAWTVAGGTLIAFGIWLAKRGGGALAKTVAAIAVIAGLVYPALTANSSVAAGEGNAQYAEKYETEAWSPQRVAELTAEGRPVFVDFTATWCATCQLNKATTLKSKAVQNAFAAHDVAFLVADFTRKDPVIAGELKRRQRAGVPMYLWYAAGATEPEILPEVLSQKLVIGLVTSE
ncbi:Cytochrome c-type biogenesis protein DsbD,protein-disulfide reductase [hydrothermal vent metagenome]|uniref:Cytochrome c-type biogenesis protein DsbD,protein-disulfide reductase n=1 Tax=hydrothermal vent metagenome TaxID=652676 RepID=A0A160TZR2_9ZZZZ